VTTNINSFEAIKAVDIAQKTNNAYMASDYGPQEWLAITVFLMEKDFNEYAIECVLRSKHMRWCSDGRDIQTCKEFVRYYNNNRSDVRRDLRDWNTEYEEVNLETR
jgi:hypothetical protein